MGQTSLFSHNNSTTVGVPALGNYLLATEAAFCNLQ